MRSPENPKAEEEYILKYGAESFIHRYRKYRKVAFILTRDEFTAYSPRSTLILCENLCPYVPMWFNFMIYVTYVPKKLNLKTDNSSI